MDQYHKAMDIDKLPQDLLSACTTTCLQVHYRTSRTVGKQLLGVYCIIDAISIASIIIPLKREQSLAAQQGVHPIIYYYLTASSLHRPKNLF